MIEDRSTRRRSQARRWCVPPAIESDPADHMAGEMILVESPGDFGVLLWRTSRDLALLLATPRERRSDLITEESAAKRLARITATPIPEDLSAAISTITRTVVQGSNGDTDVLTPCCLQIASWAKRAGLTHTCIAFAQAGAQATPWCAEAALQTGIAAATAGQIARADSWLRRTVDLARREGDRAAYATALVERGLIRESLRDQARAEHLFRKAYLAGAKAPHRPSRARAAYGLFRLALAQEQPLHAAQHALAAYRACTPQTEDAAALLFDVARFWTEMGEYARAEEAVSRFLRTRGSNVELGERLLVTALTARASAPANPAESVRAAAEAWELMDSPAIRDDARLVAGIDLAHAAQVVSDQVAFTRARLLVLRIAPKDRYEILDRELRSLCCEGDKCTRS